MRDVGLMAEELRSARRDGVACIVDAGLEGSGMDLEFIRAAATQSGLPVVKAAGFYTEPFYPKEVATMSEEQLVRALVRQADDYPAGAFGEIGSWDEISALERKVFRAVGKAHGATNLAVFTHTGIPGKSALEQLDILEDSVSTRSASASATSGISTTRRSTCTRRSAGAARSSASTGRAAAATRPSCRSCSRCSTRGSPTTC
jgi:predicted metal-dependent phosphotriesterase family hydrolase